MRVLWLVGALFLLAVAAVGGFLSLFGIEALVTGANVGGWLSLFLPGVVLPVVGCVFCVVMFFRRQA